MYRYLLFLFSIVFLIFFLSGCHGIPSYWHSNGTVIKDITWEIPIRDSSTVLQTDGSSWKLPQLADSIVPQITYTTYRAPRYTGYLKILGRIDQEVVHSNDTNNIEFYRFEKGNVLLLGFATPDTSRPVTVFDPPLIIIPSNLKDLEKSFISSGIMKTWNGNKFDEGSKSTFTITKKQTGRFIAEDGTEKSVILCENTFSRDATMQYGQTNLIIPDAMTLTSNSLLDEEDGAILEWGIRSRKIGKKEERLPVRNIELYIEITVHKKE